MVLRRKGNHDGGNEMNIGKLLTATGELVECGIMGKEIALRMARAKAARGKAKK